MPSSFDRARAAEQRIRGRGLHDRLGYRAYGRAPESWDEEAPDGTVTRYDTMVTLMCKELP